MKKIESLFLGFLAAMGALIFEAFLLLIFSLFSAEEINLSFESLQGFSILNDGEVSLPPLLIFLILFIFIEELFKYIVIVKRLKPFLLEKQVALSSLFVGLGFAIAELFLLFEKMGEDWVSVIVSRNAAEVMLIHILTAGTIGYFLAIQDENGKATFLKAIFSAFLIHFTYNLMVIYRNDFLDGLIALLLTFLVLLNIFNIMTINKRLASQRLL